MLESKRFCGAQHGTSCSMPPTWPLMVRVTLTVHQQGIQISVFTTSTLSWLTEVSEFIHGWADHGHYCEICQTIHSAPQLCFHIDILSGHDFETLQGLLDNTLQFTWDTEHQFTVFALCCHFLMDQDFVFPAFYRSLRHEYAQEKEKYRFLELIYTIVDAEYTVLATHLLDYFNKFSHTLFVPQSLLFRSRSLPAFLAAARAPTPTLTKMRRFHTTAILSCP